MTPKKITAHKSPADDATKTNAGIKKHKAPLRDPFASARSREVMNEATRVLREAGAEAAKNRAETQKHASKNEPELDNQAKAQAIAAKIRASANSRDAQQPSSAPTTISEHAEEVNSAHFLKRLFAEHSDKPARRNNSPTFYHIHKYITTTTMQRDSNNNNNKDDGLTNTERAAIEALMKMGAPVEATLSTNHQASDPPATGNGGIPLWAPPEPRPKPKPKE
ncbi:hypothetical protein BDV97DRAFT_395910 [Delphinella strobiligena]|nr:hypothetical protein BDV97DRAFT_395910 [Delphinella strobiligena]